MPFKTIAFRRNFAIIQYLVQSPYDMKHADIYFKSQFKMNIWSLDTGAYKWSKFEENVKLLTLSKLRNIIKMKYEGRKDIQKASKLISLIFEFRFLKEKRSKSNEKFGKAAHA